MISTNRALKTFAQHTQRRILSLSKDKNLSMLQEEYLKVIESLMIEKNIDSPFDQDQVSIKKFFREVSERWDRRKKELDEQV